MKIFSKALAVTALGASLMAAGPAAAVTTAPTDLSEFGTPVLKMVSGNSFDDIFSFSLANAANVTIGGSSSIISINLGTLGTLTIPAVTFTGYHFSAAGGNQYSAGSTDYTSSGSTFTLALDHLAAGNYLFEIRGTVGSPNAFAALNSGLVMSAYGVAAEAALVPEPGEWAMMLAGLGMVGAMIRRRITK
jgi:hypothetical protein